MQADIRPLADVTPFHPGIIKAHFEFNWAELYPVCKNLINTTVNNNPLEADEGKSSSRNPQKPHAIKAFEPFYKWFNPMIEHIITKEWGYDPKLRYGVVQSWVNVHTKGGWTKEHAHGAAIAVSAAYLNLPKDSGFIEFKDPLEYVKNFHQRSSLDWMWKEVPAITGDVLVFPGWMQHKTQPSNVDDERWVLTNNIGIVGIKEPW
jgi:uncharacterized protein (TIGR02466 family)